MKKKILIIGCGPVGIVAAEILSRNSFEIDIIESRNHIAGNCYDYKNKHNILVHKYGPHYFRTNDIKILKYLSKFTKWIKGNYHVKSYVNRELYDFPINLNTLEKFFKRKFNNQNAKRFLKKISIKKKGDNFENYLLSKIGKDLYESFYKNYTIKQWSHDPKKLGSSIAKRIAIKFNRNKDYIKEKYKFMPKNGFTEMFKNMLKHKNISIILNKKYKFNPIHLKKYNKIIYTGPIDAFFNFKYGKLNWRSLKFAFKHYKKELIQPSVQINYPNNYKYTRTVEYKHVTKQKSKFTSISKEFPQKIGEPYYPVSLKSDKIKLKKYLVEVKKLKENNIYFVGRLAEYTYINTDQAIEKGIGIANNIIKKN